MSFKKKNKDMNLNILVEAKKEYTEFLIDLLCVPMYEGIKSIFDISKDEVKNAELIALEKEQEFNDNPLKNFQRKLQNIPKWSEEIISREYDRIQKRTNFDKYEDLLTALFIVNGKVMSTIKLSNSKRKLKLNMPTPKNFLHKTYIEIARKFYENPRLIDDREERLTFDTIQSNVERSYEVIRMCIETTIRRLLPVKDILDQYLIENSDDESDPGSENNESDEDDESNVKDLVKNEIQNYLGDREPEPEPEDGPEKYEINDPDETLSAKPFEKSNDSDDDSEKPTLDVYSGEQPEHDRYITVPTKRRIQDSTNDYTSEINNDPPPQQTSEVPDIREEPEPEHESKDDSDSDHESSHHESSSMSHINNNEDDKKFFSDSDSD